MVVRSASPSLKRPRVAPELAERLPPGQFPTQRWPILHDGPVPAFDPATWDLRVFGLVERELRLSWDEVRSMPRIRVSADLHCVSRWSRLDNVWEGIALRDIARLAGVRPEARFVLLHADGGYTANLPHGVDDDEVLLALRHDGEDLTPEHGFPVRAIVPSRYAWKSVKWLRGIEFMAEDRDGFWEQHGYHGNADFWREERFAE